MNLSFVSNLRYGENKILKLFDIILSYYDKSFYLDPFQSFNNGVYQIINQIDFSETKNLISPLPINYLRKKFNNNLNNNGKPKKFKSEEREKEYLISLINKNNIHSILNDLYLDIPISSLFKPLLEADIEKKYLSENMKIDDDFENDNEEDFDHQEYFTSPNKDCWFSNFEINAIFDRLIYFNIYKVYAQYINTLYINPRNTTTQEMYYYNKHIFDNLDSIKDDKSNIIFIPLIFNSHFVLMTINLNLRVCYFYDSYGYDISSMKLFQNGEKDSNKKINYYFLQTDFKYVNYNTFNIYISDTRYQYVEPFVHIIYAKYGIKNFIFNEYREQRSHTECGSFIISFALMSMFVTGDKRRIIKEIYSAQNIKGGDYSVNNIRSYFFITSKDLEKYSMSEKEYKENVLNINISNSFYYQQLNDHMQLTNDFKKIQNALIGKNKDYLITQITNNINEFQGITKNVPQFKHLIQNT